MVAGTSNRELPVYVLRPPHSDIETVQLKYNKIKSIMQYMFCYYPVLLQLLINRRLKYFFKSNNYKYLSYDNLDYLPIYENKY